MIDLKDFRENPDKYRLGARQKNMAVDIDALLEVDRQLRSAQASRDQLVAEKNQIGKQIGQLAGQLKKADPSRRAELEAQMKALQSRPAQMKEEEHRLTQRIAELEPERDRLWLTVPQPPDADVPVGKGAEDNIEKSTWSPSWFDPRKSFEQNKGFRPKSHAEIGKALGLFDFERGVKMAGSRSYVLVGDGMRLAQAIVRFAFDSMVEENGFVPVSVPVLVRERMMIGTGFFPQGKEQAYEVNEELRQDADAPAGSDAAGSASGGGDGGGALVAVDPGLNPRMSPAGDGGTEGGSVRESRNLYLTGTGEVGLMGLHAQEIIDYERLPLRYTTVSTCFRREAGAAGKDTAGLYRVHQFDKVEQVVICRADEAESRLWHQKMLYYVQTLLQRLELPHRLLQCCTGDLGPKNADMVDVECWMPSRGEVGPGGQPSGAYGETHSASRLYDYQCRRLNMRYRDPVSKKPVVCHSLNNTVAAVPRLMIPVLEMFQNADGSVTVPTVLRGYMGGRERIG